MQHGVGSGRHIAGVILEFPEQSAFTRLCKRWLENTPSDIRKWEVSLPTLSK